MEPEEVVLHVPEGVVVLDADLDDKGRPAVAWAGERGTEVSRDGTTVAMLGNAGRVDAVRWVGDDLLVWPVGNGTGLLKGTAVEPGLACAPRDALVSKRFVYATYGEEQFLTGTDDSDLASDRITVFDRAGQRLFGVQDLLGRSRDDPDFNEFTRGAVTPDGRLAFVADGSPLVWVLDAGTRSLLTIRPERPVEVADEIVALVCGNDRVGLVTPAADGFAFAWYDLADGRLIGDERVALPKGEPRSGRWRARGVANLCVIAWRGRTLLRLG